MKQALELEMSTFMTDLGIDPLDWGLDEEKTQRQEQPLQTQQLPDLESGDRCICEHASYTV